MVAPSGLSRRKGQRRSQDIPWHIVSAVLGLALVILIILFLLSGATSVPAAQNIANKITQRRENEQPPAATAASNPAAAKAATTTTVVRREFPGGFGQTLLMKFEELGTIKIHLKKDLSPESVDYIQQIILSGNCGPCNIYRSQDKGEVLQGVLKNHEIPDHQVVKIPKGPCPRDILEQQPDIKDCHGPVLKHGMVAWVGGVTGPDFFFTWYDDPQTRFGNKHTVFGQLALEDSTTVEVIEKIRQLPVHNKKGTPLTDLDKPVPFTLTMA